MLAAFGWLAAVFPRSRAVRRLAARARSALTGIRRNAARMRAEARRAWHRASKATFAMEPRALVAAGTLLTALMTIVGFRRFGDQGFAGNLAAEAVGDRCGRSSSEPSSSTARCARTRGVGRARRPTCTVRSATSSWGICHAFARQSWIDSKWIRSEPLVAALAAVQHEINELSSGMNMTIYAVGEGQALQRGRRRCGLRDRASQRDAPGGAT